MTIQADVRIIDATIDRVTPTQIYLSTVTAYLEYKSAEFLQHRVDKVIPMSQPGIVIPSLIIPQSELRRLPIHLQSKAQAELKKQEGR